jgi:hypothetical protein
MPLLTGLTEDGLEVPVQVKTDGKLVAEGLPGPAGATGPAGPQGPAGPTGPSAPAASETTAGIIELATPAEVLAGDKSGLAVTPQGLKGALDLKADKATTYTKTEVDGLLSSGGGMTWLPSQASTSSGATLLFTGIPSSSRLVRVLVTGYRSTGAASGAAMSWLNSSGGSAGGTYTTRTRNSGGTVTGVNSGDSCTLPMPLASAGGPLMALWTRCGNLTWSMEGSALPGGDSQTSVDRTSFMTWVTTTDPAVGLKLVFPPSLSGTVTVGYGT